MVAQALCPACRHWTDVSTNLCLCERTSIGPNGVHMWEEAHGYIRNPNILIREVPNSPPRSRTRVKEVVDVDSGSDSDGQERGDAPERPSGGDDPGVEPDSP